MFFFSPFLTTITVYRLLFFFNFKPAGCVFCGHSNRHWSHIANKCNKACSFVFLFYTIQTLWALWPRRHQHKIIKGETLHDIRGRSHVWAAPWRNGERSTRGTIMWNVRTRLGADEMIYPVCEDSGHKMWKQKVLRPTLRISQDWLFSTIKRSKFLIRNWV